jgi:hypothetical protein
MIGNDRRGRILWIFDSQRIASSKGGSPRTNITMGLETASLWHSTAKQSPGLARAGSCDHAPFDVTGPNEEVTPTPCSAPDGGFYRRHALTFFEAPPR